VDFFDLEVQQIRSIRHRRVIFLFLLSVLAAGVFWVLSMLLGTVPTPLLALASAAVLGGLALPLFWLIVARHINRFRLMESLRAERIIRHASEGIVIIDSRGQIVSLNPAAERLFGYDTSEVAGDPITRLFIEMVPRECRSGLHDSLPVGTILGLATGAREVIGKHKDGRALALELAVCSVPFGQEHLNIAFTRDVSKRKQAQRYLTAHYAATCILAESPSLADALPRILHAICEALDWHAGGYWQLDPDAHLLRCTGVCSASDSSAVGWKPNRSDSVGGAVCGLGQGLPGRVWQNSKSEWVEDITHLPDCPCLRLLGDRPIRSAFALPILLGQEVCGVLTFFNKRPRKRDEQLLDVMATLSNQLGQFIARKRDDEMLRLAKEEAEAASRAKSEFLANVSHEVRTPLNGILGMTDLALDSPLTPQQREYLELVKTSSISLLRVINDILDFSKIEAGKLELEAVPFRLSRTLPDILKALGIRARQKGLELNSNIPESVPDTLVGDPNRLRQVLVNLLGNAIKFTDQGEIGVSVEEVGRTESDVCLHFAVSDTGIGIPADKLDLIFEPFRQADGSMTRKYGGTGLGLAITCRLIDMMAGRIWVESEVGKGSTFHFTAHFAVPRPGAAAQLGNQERQSEARVLVAYASDAPEPRSLRILLAEDNVINQRVAVRLLEKLGHTVAVANNGKEVLAAVQREHFDIVLMDVQMPEMGGFEATAKLRERERQNGGHLPIIALTAHAMKGDRERCLAAGMDGYLAKPIQTEELIQTITRLMPDAPFTGATGKGEVNGVLPLLV